MEYQKCPICNGNGLVSNGFYSHPGDYLFWMSSSVNPETCRACKGTGLILKPEVSEESKELQTKMAS